MSATAPKKNVPKLSRKSILLLLAEEARTFLLKPESYCSLDLPNYLTFDRLLEDTGQFLENRSLSDLVTNPCAHEGVNYQILSNKDGKYAWRPFELIHPALYIDLVHSITDPQNWELIRERFRAFSNNNKIKCLSLPVVSLSENKDKAEQVSHWWQEVEQGSLALALDFEHVLQTDISDCYGSIYTHSIAWALHTKQVAKASNNRKDYNLVGNAIDRGIQKMRNGQTNGIPQGSVLVDFIAEMVLGYVDLQLSERIQEDNIDEYSILRYRDDYRIFVNNPRDGEAILKLLTEISVDVGFKLNPTKTKSSTNIIRTAVKDDKLSWTFRLKSGSTLQKHLLIIHDHACAYPNSGSLIRALSDFYDRLKKGKDFREQLIPMISIVTDIAYRNPKVFSVCAAILSMLLNFIDNDDEKLSVVKRIRKKISQIPNTGYLDIWLQRVTIPFAHKFEYSETICRIVAGEQLDLWNVDWISSNKLKQLMNAKKIVDKRALRQLKPVIPSREIALFIEKYLRGY